MTVTETEIKGLYVVELDVFEDDRGNFREAWQREKMVAAGLPDITVVQQSVAYSKKGVLRGIHVEPWDKFIHVTFGEAFAAIADVRPESETFGQYKGITLNNSTAIFVSEGLGNSYQALTDDVAYSYLVTDHWSVDKKYSAVAFDDPDLGIAWPVPVSESVISEKDQNNATLREMFPGVFN